MLLNSKKAGKYDVSVMNNIYISIAPKVMVANFRGSILSSNLPKNGKSNIDNRLYPFL